MGNKITMEGFDFREFFKDYNFVNEEMKGKGVKCPVEIEEIVGGKSLKIKINLSKEGLIEKAEQELIPASELIFQEKKILNLAGEDLFLNEGDLVLILTTQEEAYYIPVIFQEKKKRNNFLLATIKVSGDILHIERKKCRKITLDKEINFYLKSGKQEGIIKNISLEGFKLVTRERIEGSILILDITFMALSTDRLIGEISWEKEINDGEYWYEVKFRFEQDEWKEELENWLEES